jgi:hypothetical protein
MKHLKTEKKQRKWKINHGLFGQHKLVQGRGHEKEENHLEMTPIAMR